ncbi:MAG: Rpn family recombination-promoting nuclease/putative transposase [Candidatus Cloacimonetes bacterium]|nr:Rpn family recombination-promoting nuclease/putative transposase [Candidatus Cloacimonadota bacterium]
MPSQDSIYKSLFSQPEVLESLLQYYGPPELHKLLDFKTLEDVGSDLLGEQGQKRQSDLIFKVHFFDKHYLYLILLLEIQGTQYNDMLVLRMLEYITLIWKKITQKDKKNKKLPPVLPILLHTGNRPFHKPTQIKKILAPHPSFLARFQPQFEFFLVDECLLAPLAKQRLDPTSILFASNQAKNIDDIWLALKHIDRLADNEELRELARQLLRWLIKISKKELNDLEIESEDIEPQNLKENLVMLQENLRKMRHQEYEKGVVFGREEGREEGLEKGLEKGLRIGIAKTLETIYQFYCEGDVNLAKTKSRMEALLGQGFDELVQEYLNKLP